MVENRIRNMFFAAYTKFGQFLCYVSKKQRKYTELRQNSEMTPKLKTVKINLPAIMLPDFWELLLILWKLKFKKH